MSDFLKARIEALQQELEELAKAVPDDAPPPPRPTKLRGLWKGLEISESDLSKAARSVFKGTEDASK